MRVNGLLELAHGRVIAESSYDGHILFDTSRNKKKHIQKYLDYAVLDICGDVVTERGKWDYYARVYPVLRVMVGKFSVMEENEND